MVTDGSRLYFVTPKKTGLTIAQVSISGGETAAIDSHFDDIQLAAISPNGSELMIARSGDAMDVPIYILPLPAGLPRRVGDILAHDASWSPNGEQIVYARGNELFLAKPDGSESHRLVTLARPASGLRWSPDKKYCGSQWKNRKAFRRHCGKWPLMGPAAPFAARMEQSPVRVLRQLDPRRELLCL